MSFNIILEPEVLCNPLPVQAYEELMNGREMN